jgi:hypothetical protein
MKMFYQSLPETFVAGGGEVERRLLREYGAVLVARDVVPPPKIIFANAFEVETFQSSVPQMVADVGGIEFRLQRPAMTSLLAAVAAANARGTSITPRGVDSGSRSYDDTLMLWASRVGPALDHWLENGRLTAQECAEVRSLSTLEQIERVLQLEEKGLFFAKDLSKSILYSVAPPGASQHLAMLAFDVAEHDDPAARDLLAAHGWHQTVASDLPHFTFLGMKTGELETVGLRRVETGERTFWVPDI